VSFDILIALTGKAGSTAIPLVLLTISLGSAPGVAVKFRQRSYVGSQLL
jgi:hypothetical protein